MSISNFVKDETTREEVFEYILKHLDIHALTLVYKGEDTRAMKDAKEALLKAKSKMILEFGEKKNSTVKNRAV